jgi:uncharacterized protein (TIGR02246 family)
MAPTARTPTSPRSPRPRPAVGVRARPADAETLFERWNASLATRDALRVLANYTPDAVLLATMSGRPRTTPGDIADYFAAFLRLAPQARVDWRTVRSDRDTLLDAGLYTFTTAGGTIEARYSFLYVPVDGVWLIAHHHSSVLPGG